MTVQTCRLQATERCGPVAQHSCVMLIGVLFCQENVLSVAYTVLHSLTLRVSLHHHLALLYFADVAVPSSSLECLGYAHGLFICMATFARCITLASVDGDVHHISHMEICTLIPPLHFLLISM